MVGKGNRDGNINEEKESLIGYLLHSPYWGLHQHPDMYPVLESKGDFLVHTLMLNH